MNRNKWNIVLVSLLAIILGFVLQSIHMILPWLFGPIFASLIVIKVLKRTIKWPIWLGNIGLLILGVQMALHLRLTSFMILKMNGYKLF